MKNHPYITRCGLPGIELIPFGMHACHFYRNREELLAALVPYFVAGMHGKERCVWITAPPLPAAEAVQAMRGAWDSVDDAIATGALRILDDQWCMNSAGLKEVDMIGLWIEEEEHALAEGYNGLRIAGNTSYLKPADWSTYMQHEKTVTERLNGRQIVALCSYDLDHCRDQKMFEAIHTHNCVFDCLDGYWRVYPAP
jgi:two-component system, sensor histidine kinase PdtaS